MKPLAFFALVFFSAIALVAHSRLAPARSEGVPRLPVETSCHEAQIYGTTDPQQTYRNCMLDETDAKKRLQEKWLHYKAATRQQCLAAGIAPSPSYVELLTCIEMTEDVLNPTSGNGMTGGGAAAAGSAYGSPSPRPALAPGPRAMPH